MVENIKKKQNVKMTALLAIALTFKVWYEAQNVQSLLICLFKVAENSKDLFP